MSVSKDELTFRGAIKEAIDEELAADENVINKKGKVRDSRTVGFKWNDWTRCNDVLHQL